MSIVLVESSGEVILHEVRVLPNQPVVPVLLDLHRAALKKEIVHCTDMFARCGAFGVSSGFRGFKALGASAFA